MSHPQNVGQDNPVQVSELPGSDGPSCGGRSRGGGLGDGPCGRAHSEPSLSVINAFYSGQPNAWLLGRSPKLLRHLRGTAPAGRGRSLLSFLFPLLVRLQILWLCLPTGSETTPLATSASVSTCQRSPPGLQCESGLCPRPSHVPRRPGIVHPFTAGTSSDLRSPCSPCLRTWPLAAPLGHTPQTVPLPETSLLHQLRGAALPGRVVPPPPCSLHAGLPAWAAV